MLAQSADSELDHAAMWKSMRGLLDRVFAVIESECVTDDCLDVLVELLGADRGLVLLTFADGSTQAVNARGRNKALDAREREEISRTIAREALEADRCVLWSSLSSTQASSSMHALGIVAALAAPLHVRHAHGSGRRAVIYVDFRRYRAAVQERQIEFFMTAALLFGAVLEQELRNRVTRDQLREAESHRVEASVTPSIDDLLGFRSLDLVRSEVKSAIESDSPILILGDSGTGKTLLAQAIAEASRRRPIVRAVLGSSDDLNTITSELFGHERGSFSGATSRRIGLVEYARNGTLILDEVLNLSPHAQKLLLDFTQFGTYRPLGYEKPDAKRAKVRIIGATNGDLRAAVRDGRFRLDLFHRLAAVMLELPPLRERREDTAVLAERTLARLDPRRTWTLSLELRRLLVCTSIQWSGNIRQLEAVISRARERALLRDPDAVVLGAEHIEARQLDGGVLEQSSANSRESRSEPAGAIWQRLQAARSQLDEDEESVIRRALVDAHGVVAQAARELGVARTTLASRIDTLKIRVPRETP